MGWTAADLPDLSGKTLLVTGANSGLGYETAKALAGAGGEVVLACRDENRGREAADRIRGAHRDARVEVRTLDLASLEAIRAFAEAWGERPLDVLVNNAGVMALPLRRTADGFEMQLGTNHLGHFALTGRLLRRLLARSGSRVVTVSSSMHKIGRMRWDDLQSERSYGKWRAYAQSKLANLLFAYELQRRLDAAGRDALSLAAHPGYAATNLQTTGPRMEGSTVMERISLLGNRLFSQTAEMGALPTVYAAGALGVKGGDYFGPDGFQEARGHPTRVESNARSHDGADQLKLWETSEDLTGVRYGL